MNDAELLRRFEDCSLPFETWRVHETHVRVSFLMLREHGFDEARARMQRGIRAINEKGGVVDGPLTGYNETTTHAFLHLIDATMRAYGEVFPTPDAQSFVETHPQLLSKHVLRLFYSPGWRLHPDAKANFVEPDMAPLPDAGKVRKP